MVARESYGQAVTYKNCRNATDIGGTNNFTETVLEVNEVAFQGKLSTSNFSNNMNGTMVKLAFLENLDKPIIIGGGTHTRYNAATKEDGVRHKSEFNGVQKEINKNGEWIQTHIGPKKANGELIRPETGPTSFKVDQKGDYEFKQSQGENVIQSHKFEREAEKYTITFQSGMTITIDGQNDAMTIQTSGGAKAVVDGTNDTVELKDNGTGALKITGEKVAIGASSAELLQQISDQLEKIAEWANSVGSAHDHVGNLGYPTAPPTQAADYVALGTDLSSIKALVDGIKGTL
ncbi:MAG: hypothetical protein GWN01_00775 [Nitrosopumilaceae archaeon]|nr:hypothetical protein [Nitrosopumilaceae archaeon]NIU85884.1 hypothetical protein [Nitrosopumilaceae archaeon]NIX60117.1 hypothetical protein [Nitrosopumilaceae archaeon]